MSDKGRNFELMVQRFFSSLKTAVRVVPASGALSHFKGDVRVLGEDSRLLIECKYTEKNSFSFKNSIWKKIEKEAFAIDATPVMALDIGGVKLGVISLEELRDLQKIKEECEGT